MINSLAEHYRMFCTYDYYASGQDKIDAQKAFECGACMALIEFTGQLWDYSAEDIDKFTVKYYKVKEALENSFKPSASKFSDFKLIKECDVTYHSPERITGDK